MMNWNDTIVAFCDASEQGDLSLVKKFLARDHDLMFAEHPERSRRNMPTRAIHLAAIQGHAGMVRFLLESGDDPLCEFFHNYKVPCALSLAKTHAHDLVVAVIEAHIARRINAHPSLLYETFRPSENTLLHLAVYHGHISLIKYLLDHRVDIDRRNGRGTRPIHLALYDGMGGPTPPILRDPDLLAAGALIAHGCQYDIWVASAVGDVSQVAGLLEENPDRANENNGAERYPYGANFPLTIAAHGGHLSAVHTLLDSGADPDCECPERPFAESENPESGTPLIFSIQRRHFDVARLLLDCGARVDYSRIDSGPNIPITALRSKNESLINRIIIGGGKPLLGHYVQTKNYLVIRELLDRCPEDPTVLQTFLSSAARCCDPNVMEMCLAQQPEVQTAGLISGIIRFAYALSDRHDNRRDDCLGVLSQLLEHGANPNAVTSNGETGLHLLSSAAKTTAPPNCDILTILATMLLDCGADPDIVAKEPQVTALGMAVIHNRTDLVKLLLERGADPNLPTESHDMQPLNLAEARGFGESTELLRTTSKPPPH